MKARPSSPGKKAKGLRSSEGKRSHTFRSRDPSTSCTGRELSSSAGSCAPAQPPKDFSVTSVLWACVTRLSINNNNNNYTYCKLACKGPKGGLQAGRTDTRPSLRAL
eukprot:6413678-Pyramimonas_sp.AAC.1